MRYLSCEPLLGDLDLVNIIAPLTPTDAGMERKRLFDWVMVGGESGFGARRMHPDWVRSLQKQCSEADVAFWFKQWGGASTKSSGALLDGKLYEERPTPRQRHDQTVSVPQELSGDFRLKRFQGCHRLS